MTDSKYGQRETPKRGSLVRSEGSKKDFQLSRPLDKSIDLHEPLQHPCPLLDERRYFDMYLHN